MAASGEPHALALQPGSLRTLLYAPRGTDHQSPHKRDEIYIVAQGAAGFRRGDERRNVTAGDMLFVPAGMTHRFEAMSDDFACWVIFWGPDGGEPRER